MSTIVPDDVPVSDVGDCAIESLRYINLYILFCCKPDNVTVPLLPRQVVGLEEVLTVITGGIGSASTIGGNGSDVHPFADVTVANV